MSSTNSTPSQGTPPSSTQSTRSSSPASGKASKPSADPLTDALRNLTIGSQGKGDTELDEKHKDKVVEPEKLERKAKDSSSAPVMPKNETQRSSTALTASTISTTTSVSLVSSKSRQQSAEESSHNTDSGDKDVVGNGKSHGKSSIAPLSRNHTSSGLKRTRGQEDVPGKPQKRTKTGERPILPIGTKKTEIGTGKKETGKKDKE